LVSNRFKAIIVEHGPDLQYVGAYIHLNPARAGMVEKLIDYPWSSHRQYTGGVEKGLAETERILGLFSKNRKAAVEQYEKYMEQVAKDTSDEKKARIYVDYVMGSEGFVRDVKLMFKDKKLPDEIVKRRTLRKIYNPCDVIKNVREYFKISENELLYKKGKWNRGKKILIYLLVCDAGLTFAETGRMLGGLTQANVGRIYKKTAEECGHGKTNEPNAIRLKYVKVQSKV
jgi:hypothetical protein